METLIGKKFWGVDLEVLSTIRLKNRYFDNKSTPGLNIIIGIKKLLYIPQTLYYLFGEKLVWCNMSIT